MKTENTTIKISRETKQRLDNLKENGRETYEQVITKILYVLNQIRKNTLLGNKILGNINRNIKRKKDYEKKAGLEKEF
jgi:predicted DNA-binding protein